MVVEAREPGRVKPKQEIEGVKSISIEPISHWGWWLQD
jgi:hypothetical protein